MKNPGFQPVDPQPLKSRGEHRARHFPRSLRLMSVALLLTLSFFGIGTFIWGVVGIILWETPMWGWLALGGLVTFALTRFIAFLVADPLTCPLCHGQVMREKRCRKHRDAFKLGPLPYRASAVISLLFTWSFRCMYCGTPFRLGKRRH